MARCAGVVAAMGCGVIGRRFDDGQVLAWVRASCEAQGVDLVVTDPEAVAVVATLLTGRAGPPGRKRGSAAPAGRPAGSESPHGSDPVRVNGLRSGASWADHGMVEDGSDDLGLAG